MITLCKQECFSSQRTSSLVPKEPQDWKKSTMSGKAGAGKTRRPSDCLTDARINILRYHTPKAIYEPISTANKTPYLRVLRYSGDSLPGLLLAVKHWSAERLNFIAGKEISM